MCHCSICRCTWAREDHECGWWIAWGCRWPCSEDDVPTTVTSPPAPHDQHQQSLVELGPGRQDTQAQSLAQGGPGVIASSSDNLFLPVPNLPSSYVFTLTKVPSNPCLHAYNHISSPLKNPSLGPPPQIPPCIPPQSVHPPTFAHPQFTHPQHMYNHSQPAFQQYPHIQPVFQHQPIHNPPVQPLYQIPTVHVPLPPSSPLSSSSISKTLPTIMHITVLTTKHDFFAWDKGVNSLIHANGLLGHILDPSIHVDPTWPDLAPSPPPVLSTTSSAREIEASNCWWAADNVVQHILVSQLGSILCGLLPLANTISRTALLLYQTLTRYYGTCTFVECTELLLSLYNSTCTSGHVPEFISR